MKPQHYLAIILRIFAIALFIYSLRQFSFVYEFFVNGNINGLKFSALFILATAIITMFIAFILWLFPLTLSKKIIGKEYNLELEALNAPSMLAILILAIGFYFLFYAIIDTIYWLII